MASLSVTTVSFAYTGASQNWVVPSGVSLLKAQVSGAAGGGAGNSVNSGGYGGIATTNAFTIPVTAGETLMIRVGQRGIASSTVAAFNGGGLASQNQNAIVAGGGGGATDIRRQPYTLADRLFVGGGGGGALGPLVSFNLPNGGGLVGGTRGDAQSGLGGTQVSGGTGGIASGGVPGADGVFGSGGNAGGSVAFTISSGGGGGGYYGGGGGSTSATLRGEGGGGSGFAASNFSASVTYSIGSSRTDGSATIQYTPNTSDMTFIGNTCYAVDNSSNLYVLDLIGGTLTPVGVSSLPSQYTGLSATKYGVLYMSTSQVTGAIVQLWRVDPGSGAPTFVANLTTTMSGYLISGLCFDANDTLWAAAFTTQTAGPSSLFSISNVTGTWVATNRGPIPTSDNTKVLGTLAALPPACVHETSLVNLPGSERRMIRDLKQGEWICLANGHLSRVKHVVACGTRNPVSIFGENSHMCLVFEPDSMAPGVPTARFAVDPGHPICDPRDYAAVGHLALRMARVWFSLAKPGSVIMTTWDQVEALLRSAAAINPALALRGWKNEDPDKSVQSVKDFTNGRDRTDSEKGPLVRYDLILEDGPTAYVANGVAVFSRFDIATAGYDHSAGFY